MLTSNTPVLDKFIQANGLDWVIAHAMDTRAVENPYHNPDHCKWVAERAMIIHRSLLAPERDRDGLFPPELAIVIAGLMHDYDHLGGLQSCDHDNIQRALAGVDKIAAPIIDRFGADTLALVKRLIIVTEYPFIYDPQDPYEKALRDADLLYGFSEHGPKAIMEGLRQEMARFRKADISYAEMYEGQVAFFKSATFHTNYGKYIAAKYTRHILGNMQAYISESGQGGAVNG